MWARACEPDDEMMEEVYCKLWSYENTGLEPEEICFRASRWISVKDRFPDIDAEVLIVTGEGLYEVAQYSGADRFWTLERNPLAWVTVADVTHWMPLPEPPKEE